MDPLANPVIVLLASVLPLLIAVLKQSTWSPQVNATIAFVVYIVAGIAGTLFSGTALTIENALPIVTSVTVIGTIAYQLVWSNLGKATDTDLSVEEALMEATTP